MENFELLLTLLTIFGSFMSLLGVPQLFGRTWKDVFARLFHGGISWKEVEKLTSNIVSQMNNDKPDLIIGVGRGGIISVGLLCSTLTNDGSFESGIRQSKTITIETVNTFQKPDRKRPQLKGRVVSFPLIYEVQPIDFDLSVWKNKSILVIIGETITGQTLSSMKKQIDDLCKSGGYCINVKFATLAMHDTRHNTINSIEIDYIGKKYERKIKMPWKN